MDWISQLPESIIHHILSCFETLDAPPADLVRMSVLSKTWFHLTASFPVLDFSIHNFTKGSHASRRSFFKYVDCTTARFCHHNVTARTLRLITTIQEPAELEIVNKCIELVLRNGVRGLEIDITNSSYAPESPSPSAKPMPKYRLPDTLLSVSVLKYLSIHGCDLPSSLMFDGVKFKSLIYLALEDVPIDDEVIKYLATSCPLLEVFQITSCRGLKRLCVYGHQNLQSVWICYETSLERIDIEAPNLTDLCVIDTYGRGAPQMNLASCKKLTSVLYMLDTLPKSNGCTSFLSNFPFIENLVLRTDNNCKNLKLSSHSLRTLVLHSNCDLEEIEFSAPNLVSFIYAYDYDVPWPDVLKDLTHMKACMHCYPGRYIVTLWFQKLRLFLHKKNGFKVLNLYIHAIYSQKFTESEKLKSNELPPYELEHVELQLDTREEPSTHVAFLDAVIWCCRPRSLTLRSSFPFIDFEDVVKFTYEKLLEQEDQGRTNIEIVSPSSSEAQKHFMDLKSLSMALPREENTISFIKEEVVEEEAQ